MIAATGSTQAPAFGLAGTLVAMLVLLVGVLWLLRRTAQARGVAVWVPAAGLTGLAATMLALFVAGMRHYGGSVDVGGSVQSNCAIWWAEAGLPAGQRAAPGDLSPSCRHAALAAIGPALLVAALIGLAVAVAVVGSLLLVARRRARGNVRLHGDRGTVVE